MFLSTLVILLSASLAKAGDNDVAIAAALKYIRAQQNDDGSFGKSQPRLQTGMAMLAIASMGDPPTMTRSRKSDAALLSRPPNFSWPAPRSPATWETIRFEPKAMRSPQRRCSAASSVSPTLISGRRSARNSRGRFSYCGRIRIAVPHPPLMADGRWRAGPGATTTAGRRRGRCTRLPPPGNLGLDVRPTDLERGAKYLLGSFKSEPKQAADHDSAEIKPEDVGGLSVDETGLTVETISAMGGWALTRIAPNADGAKKNFAWLTRNPPAWTGPNYFYANFFRACATRMLDAGSDDTVHRRLCDDNATHLATNQRPPTRRRRDLLPPRRRPKRSRHGRRFFDGNVGPDPQHGQQPFADRRGLPGQAAVLRGIAFRGLGPCPRTIMGEREYVKCRRRPRRRKRQHRRRGRRRH